MSTALGEFLARQLQRLPGRWGLRIDGNRGWIRCPFHKNGNENTPSFVINLENSEDGRAGQGHCFGCKTNRSWNSYSRNDEVVVTGIADTLKLQPLRRSLVTAGDGQMIEDEEIPLPDLKAMLPWPVERDWRGISGKLLNKVGGHLEFVRDTERLYLPVWQRNEIVGGIHCHLYRRKDGRSYINTDGQWSLTALFPYDYVRDLIKKNQLKVLVLGEGPRDALNPLQYDIPTLALLGTGSWSKTKLILVTSLIALGIDHIVLAFDPDEAGRLATQTIKADLTGLVRLSQMHFQPEVRNTKGKLRTAKEDLGNMRRSKIDELVDLVYG